MLKKDGELILKLEKLLENIIRFNQRHDGTNIDAYISYSINIEVKQYQQLFVLNTHVWYLNARYIALVAVGKGAKKKTTKRNIYNLRTIKDWSVISNI